MSDAYEVNGLWRYPVKSMAGEAVEAVELDADDATQVFQGMFPIIDAGTAQVRPVGDFAAMLKARAEANA